MKRQAVEEGQVDGQLRATTPACKHFRKRGEQNARRHEREADGVLPETRPSFPREDRVATAKHWAIDRGERRSQRQLRRGRQRIETTAPVVERARVNGHLLKRQLREDVVAERERQRRK